MTMNYFLKSFGVYVHLYYYTFIAKDLLFTRVLAIMRIKKNSHVHQCGNVFFGSLTGMHLLFGKF